MHTTARHRDGIRRPLIAHARRNPAIFSTMAGVAVVVALTITPLTAAAWTDQALLSTSVGGSNRFDIGLVPDPKVGEDGILTGGTVRQGDGDGVGIELPGGDNLVPGGTVVREIAVFNNAPSLGADVAISIAQTERASVDITDYLTLTVTDVSSGKVIIDGRYLSELLNATSAPATFALTGRGPDHSSLDDAGPFSAGNDGSSRRIELRIHYTDVTATGASETAELNGGKSFVRVRFDAESR